ncbi:MAG: hypothetical protein ACHP9Y_05615, partial [Gammaproteobacteria bacterium]
MLQSFSLLIIAFIAILAAFYFLLGGRRTPWLGKILGFILGYIVAHAPGALIGLLLGHVFDMLMSLKKKPQIPFETDAAAKVKANPSFRTEDPTSIEYLIYFDTLFSLLGHFAQAAGEERTVYLNKLHIIMDQMELDAAQQRSAW